MNIAVVGASGNLGGAIAREAEGRGHHVSRLGRPAVDVTEPASIERAVAGHDAVVASVKGPGQVVSRGARALLDALPLAGVDRLVFVGGGGSLEHSPGVRYIDLPDFPAPYLDTATDQAGALETFLSADTPVDWSYVSPPPRHLVVGDRTGRPYRVEARDTPLVGDDGESRITVGDFASAVVDALENRSFVRRRFTTAY